METVDLKTRLGRPLAQFGILPMADIPPSMFDEQYELMKEPVQASGYGFYFLVTSDRICGWKLGEPSPFFIKPTEAILGRYARSPDDVRSARTGYLAALVGAWLGDLKMRWKSGPSQAPAEEDFKSAGLLDQMQAT